MTDSGVIHEPVTPHRCDPGWKRVPLADDHHLRAHGYTHQFVHDPLTHHAMPGTVWRCECGMTWVARRNVSGQCYARWVVEGSFAQWRRERRERKASR